MGFARGCLFSPFIWRIWNKFALYASRCLRNINLIACRKREETKIDYNVLLTMDIGTNELTRPFRIPRRRTGENCTMDAIPDKSKRLRLGGHSDSRSPLASTSSVRKNDSAFSSRIVPPTKKKPTQDHQQTPIHSRKSKPGELFDRILDSMVNPPKERKKDAPQDDVDEAGPSGMAVNISSSPPKRSTSGLTREDLERHQNDDSSCYAFMQREGLMERLLGHKMLTGRVDSHIALGFLPFDPKDNSPSRNRKNSSSKVDDFPTICEPPPVGIANEERRGPKTPPGSPGHDANSSMLSSGGVGSASPSSPPPPPPIDETVAFSREGGKLNMEETPDLIAEMAELTKLPHNQLAECLGEELQKAMKQVDHKVLLETLKDALLKVGKKNDDQQDGQNQPVSKEDMRMYPVEMDLESNKSVSGNGVLLPPPPPAPLTPPSPNMIPALPVGIPATPVVMAPTVLPTPPPPPPLVMLHPGTASQVLVSTSATGNAPSLYPYFPPPPPHQLTADQNINPSTVAGPQTSTATASVIFGGVPYAANLVATSPLAVPAVPSLNLVSHASAATVQPSGMVNAFQNIHTAPSHVAATPLASAATSFANQTPAFALYPGPSSQQLPPTTATFAASNHYLSATAATTTGDSLTTATVSSLQQQLCLQLPKPSLVSNSLFGCGLHQTATDAHSTVDSNCNISELKTSQNPYHSQYQPTDYSSPLQQHQYQKKQHQNPNLPETSNGTTAIFGTQCQQLQPDEKSFSTNFTHLQPLQLQTSLESVPTSSNATFNGGEIGSSRFFSSGTMKIESVSANAAVASGYNSDRSLLGGAINNTSANFGSSKSPDEPVSVPSSQNVIKTLLSALSIPQSGDSVTTVTAGVAPNNSSSIPETSDGDQEVDFCWPPANMDARWSQEHGPSVPEKTKKTIPRQPSSSCSQTSNASRMMFFDQPASANSTVLSPRTGTSMVRPRPPVPPPIQNRMPLNRLPRGLPGSSLLSGPLSGGLRVRPLFRPSGSATYLFHRVCAPLDRHFCDRYLSCMNGSNRHIITPSPRWSALNV
ncbi:Synaptic defective enhancer [Dirofilaria immitis]